MTNTFKTLFKNTNNKYYVEIFSYNDRKFKIEITHRNGGYLPHVDVMKDDGTFAFVADSMLIGYKYENYYFLDDDDSRIKATNDECLSALKNFVKAVYSV